MIEHGQPPESLVVLAVPNLDALHAVHDRLVAQHSRCTAFHEPDLNDELTAIAVGPEARRALSSLPLLR